MRTGPLTSLKVIELCNVVAGPFAGSLLADWGADVIKIEMPGKGDPFRAFLPYDDANHEVSLRWITMGRNKRCVTLDLHGEKGHKILLDLVKDADLVIENFRPGTLEKWGIGYDAMKAVNPKVVLVEAAGRTASTVNGRLDNNLVVEFQAPESLIGQWANVHLTGSRAALLVGELVQD